MKRTRLVTLGGASLAIAALGTFGCNLLVSAGDYHVDDSAGDATTIGDSGPGVDVANGDGGGSHDTGAHDTSTTDHASPDTGPQCGTTLPTGTSDFQQLVKACVLHFACSPTADSTGGATSSLSIGTCIAEDDLGLFGATACEKNAQNCADIAACSGYGFATGTDCDGGTSVHCDVNGHAVVCDPTSNSEFYPGYYIDCTHQGGTCKTYKDPEAGVSAPLQVGCEVVAKCTDQNDTEHCSANDQIDYTCVGGIGYGFNCNNFQTHCDPTAPGCYYNAANCDAGLIGCTGPSREICPGDGTQFQLYHCEHAGTACAASTDDAGDTVATCVAPGCDPASCAESCNGDTLEACVGGAQLPVDCTQFGYHCKLVDLFDINNNQVTLPRCLP